MRQTNFLKKLSIKLKSLKIRGLAACVLLPVLFMLGVNCKNKLFEFPPPLNTEPVASFAFENQKNSLQVIFSAASSFDPDGEIVDYSWTFGDGSNGEGIETFHNYEEAGRYFVELRVTDDDEAESTLLKEIEVYTSNILPSAVLTTNATTGNLDFVWQFDGSASSDQDGYIEEYNFEIMRRLDEAVIDTFKGNQNLIVYMFKKAHLLDKSSLCFKIKLTVTDNRGETADAYKIISVTGL